MEVNKMKAFMKKYPKKVISPPAGKIDMVIEDVKGKVKGKKMAKTPADMYNNI